MNIISYGLRTGFSKAIIALKDTKQFKSEVKSAATRVMFTSASVGGLSWSSLLGAKNDLKLAIAKTLFEHGDLPKTGPIEITRFRTSESTVRVNDVNCYVVTDVHGFTYKGKEYLLEFGPIFKSDNIHYDYSLKGDYNPF